MMDRRQLLRQLKQESKAKELYEVTQFVGYRQDPEGDPGDIIAFQIQVLDAGPDAPAERRYIVVAQDDDDRMTTGDEAESLEAAIAAVHWHELDEPPEPDDDVL